MREIREIIVHASATQPDWMSGKPLSDKVAEIDRWHRGRGWSDIGYHYVIDRDGQVAAGRPVDTVGAHVRGRNQDTIGVCLLGGFGGNADDPFREHYTAEQEVSLRSLLADLQGRYAIRHVSGHNQHAAKACPCFNVPDWLGVERAPDRPTLRLGSRDRFVLDLQEALGRLGFHAGAKDGIYGRYTERAVMAFQAANDLTSDGIVGRMTWAALEGDPWAAQPREHVSTKSLREAGSRTIEAGDKVQVAQVVGGGAALAGATATLTAELRAARDGIEEVAVGVGASGPLAEVLPWALVVLSFAGLAVAAYTWRQASRVKAARTEDAQTGAHVGR